MKYALLIHHDDSNWGDLSEQERAQVTEEYMAINADERVYGGAQLQPMDLTTTVRRNGSGEALLTDGPFVASKEHLGGFFLVEADNLDEATALAAKIPALRTGGVVEVRPVVER
jgi:hypothetical protein